MLDRFNGGGYLGRIRSGRLLEVVIESRAPRELPPGEPEGTRSERVEYRTPNGRTVAVIHRYLRPDGSLGASGKPDPKALLDRDRRLNADVWYVLDPAEE